MLRGATRLAHRGRPLCSVAAPPPLLGKVQTLISDLKAGSSYSGYEPDQFAADVKAGKVNTTLLADTFDFSDEYKKVPRCPPLPVHTLPIPRPRSPLPLRSKAPKAQALAPPPLS
mmetsp:Transcript_6963/g.15659  ORF Transcript_6963/g.15659 Transcript_6963/m.15659 type:complete len:115 (+) Transcript_6963:28-372(+)